MQKRTPHLRLMSIVATILLLAATLFTLFWPPSNARAAVQATWRSARDAGGYTFRADVVQQVIPIATITNVGRTSREYRYHLEGKSDLVAHSLELTLWDQGGSVFDTANAAQLKVVDGVASMRRGNQPWQPIDDISGSFAPAGDFMGFLSGASNVVDQGQQTRNNATFTRYTFDLDGPGYAKFMRDQLQASGIPPSNYIGQNGLYGRSDLTGLNLAQYPSILVECGNMKNPADSALMESAEGRQKYADALVRGVAGFLASQGQAR